MNWRKRLKSVVKDKAQRRNIIYKLTRESAEFRDELFVDDDDDVVRASLLALIEPAVGGIFSCFLLEQRFCSGLGSSMLRV